MLFAGLLVDGKVLTAVLDVGAITIRLGEINGDQAGEETFYKVKKSTQMEKVFKAYAQKKGVCQRSFLLSLDGDPIRGSETPQTLELDDHDQIDVIWVLAQN